MMIVVMSCLVTVLSIISLQHNSAVFGAQLEKTIRSGEHAVFVVNNFAKASHRRHLRDYLSNFGGWNLARSDTAIVNNRNSNLLNFRWTVPIDPSVVKSFKIFTRAQKVLTALNITTGELAEGFVTLLRYGDIPPVVNGSHEQPENLYLMFHLSEHGSNLSCSEQVFYNKSGEVLAVVPSVFGRLVIWNSELSFTFKTSCIGDFIAERYLVLRFHPDKTQDLRSHQEENFKAALTYFPPLTTSQFSPADYLTRRFKDSRGQDIAIFDGLFSKDELDQMRKTVLQPGIFGFSEHQSQEDDDYDNVLWVSSFAVDELLKKRVWAVIQELAFFLSGEKGWYPYDVANNVIERGFHTRIHEDCEGKEHEYTFLLYLTRNWNENLYGETIFLERNQTPQGRLEYETITAVKPVYGRVCMFRNNISHSARPPSPNFDGVRLTFAVKISRSRKIGLAKMLRELLEGQESDRIVALQEMLHEGTVNERPIEMTEEDLDKALKNYRSKREIERMSEQKAAFALLRGNSK